MKKRKIKVQIIVKIPMTLYHKIHADLDRKHSFAFERIGFVFSSHKQIDTNNHLIILNEYMPVEDSNYIQDNKVGGRINATAIRDAVNANLHLKKGSFAVHKHLESGIPTFSKTDLEELPKISETFCTIFRKEAHGLLLLSEDKITCLVWLPGIKQPVLATKCVAVGNPMNTSLTGKKIHKTYNKRYSRQSFLGSNSQELIQNSKIGIVGLGGGGSHIVQQLSYLGFTNMVIVDPDHVDESNLNRLVGATARDVKYKTFKINVAKRVIKSILPISNIQFSDTIWQECRPLLEDCDIIIGCLDSYISRRDLESFCRRHLIHYIDIGMVVNKYESNFFIVGQIISSTPGNACMQCLGFINEIVLAQEAAKYGDAGEQPQVVWSNGVLASTAVGILVSFVTGWTKSHEQTHYLSYDGNKNLLFDHPRLKTNGKLSCKHYPIEKSGNFF